MSVAAATLRKGCWVFGWLLGLCILAACGNAVSEKASPSVSFEIPSTQVESSPVTVSETPSAALSPSATATPQAGSPTPPSTSTSAPTLTAASPQMPAPTASGSWESMPVIPQVSQRAVEIYRAGLRAGNNPQAFSKIGDGEISAEWFFRAFDYGSDYYDLGPYQELSPAIAYFAGSFQRDSMAARRGYNTTLILSPDAADPRFCNPGESPLVCELNLHQPSLALLSLGTNQVWSPTTFEQEMRQILDLLLQRGVVPVLSTKADNLEGDNRINKIIADLAVEYELPLWNFRLAVQPLPDHGLQADREHLTYGSFDFSDSAMLQRAWTVRNLTALQALDATWRALAQTAP